MEVQLNTLYVLTRGASLRRDHLTLQVRVEGKTRLAVPIHHLESVALFGSVHVTPGALQLCSEQGVAVSFLSESGRLLSRVDAPGGGNVLLRRTQFRWADRYLNVWLAKWSGPNCASGSWKKLIPRLTAYDFISWKLTSG